MRKRDLSKGAILIIYCVLVFFTALFLISAVMNQGNTDMTMEMSEPTFPVVTFVYDGMDLNPLHGYAEEMDTASLRENITPLMSGRKFAFRIDTFGTEVDKIQYELRSVDGERLIENTQVYNYINNGETVTAEVQLKDLIHDHTEYSLCLLLHTDKGQVIRYYTRVMEADDYYVSDKLEYVYYFNNTTFDRVRAQDELPLYLESNSQGDNSTFHKVDIHSSLSQVTWGDLNVSRVTTPVASVKEINADTAVIGLDYYVSIPGEKGDVYYAVNENYRIRKGTERIYLLDYNRTTEQIFSIDTGVIANNKIVLGITGEDVHMVESDDGNRFAFVNAGRLYSYNITDNKLAYIFGFFDEDITDIRASYRQSDIRIFNVDEKGNVHFMVYGYMNRGLHEGQMGVAVYYYDSVLNTVEEQIFVPSDKSFALLCEDVERVAFANSMGHAYLLLDGTIYKISLRDSSYVTVVRSLPKDALAVSESSRMAAWVSGTDMNAASQIALFNLTNGKQTYIEASTGDYLRPIGFFGDDLIYGVVHAEDITTDISGRNMYPMYKIVIRDSDANILKEYEVPGIYVTRTIVENNMVSLERVAVGEDGGFIAATNDHILNNTEDSTARNTILTAVTDHYETIVQIEVRKEINTDTLQILTPKQVLFEGNRLVAVDSHDMAQQYYYVYSKGNLMEVCSDVSDAVTLAYENSGIVMNGEGRVVYAKTTRSARNQIMAISGTKIEDEAEPTTSLAVCLDTILAYEGLTKDSEQLMRQGYDPSDIIASFVEGAEVLDLSGCPLDAVLSYVEKDIPVLVQMVDGTAVLLVGYNELNTVIMNPLTGEVKKVGMQDSTAWFAENGNRFMTYIVHYD